MFAATPSVSADAMTTNQNRNPKKRKGDLPKSSNAKKLAKDARGSK